jgi:hypothetical protein
MLSAVVTLISILMVVEIKKSSFLTISKLIFSQSSEMKKERRKQEKGKKLRNNTVVVVHGIGVMGERKNRIIAKAPYQKIKFFQYFFFLLYAVTSIFIVAFAIQLSCVCLL